MTAYGEAWEPATQATIPLYMRGPNFSHDEDIMHRADDEIWGGLYVLVYCKNTCCVVCVYKNVQCNICFQLHARTMYTYHRNSCVYHCMVYVMWCVADLLSWGSSWEEA